MNSSMAESYFRYGYEDTCTEIQLDHGRLVLFLDGSTVMEGVRSITIFGSVWENTETVATKKPDFEFERFMKKCFCI